MLEVQPNNIPQELKQYDQWVVWAPKERPDGSFDKIPYQTNDRLAASDDPNTWTDFESAYKHYRKKPHRYGGVSFMLHSTDPFAGYDLDKVFNPETGEMSLEASKV